MKNPCSWCVLVLAALAAGPLPLWADVGEVLEIQGLEQTQRWQGDGGPLVISGQQFVLHVTSSSVEWSADGSRLRWEGPPGVLRARVGDRFLEWVEGSYQIGEPLLVEAPGLWLVARGGRLDVAGHTLGVSLSGGGGVGPASSWALLGGLALIIFFLMLQGGRMRRELDKPRVSLRQRQSTPE